ncbi:MAG: alpha/beta fold hydrolase, partial [Planctomycetota bacterium]
LAWPIIALAFWGTPRKSRLAAFLTLMVAFGFIADTLLECAGFVRYPARGAILDHWAPLWILTLWALFGTLFHRSMRWLLQRPLVGFVLAAIGSPMSYLAGIGIGAVEIPWNETVTLAALGAVWASGMPLWLGWARRLDPWCDGPAKIGRAAWVGGAASAVLFAICGFEALSGVGKASVREGLEAIEQNRPIVATGQLALTKVVVPFEGEQRLIPTFELDLPGVGEGAEKPPILLVHGTPSSLFVWTDVLFGEEGRGLIETGRRILAPDLPGHGATESRWSPYSFEKLVAFLDAYLESKGIEKAVVVGHSYGGEVAWRFAVRHPGRVERLVLIASSGYRRTAEETPEEERILKQHPLAYWGRHLVTRESTEKVLEISFVDGVPPGEAEENYVLVKNLDNWRAMVELARAEEGLWEERILEIRKPTLILWGEDDGNFPIDSHAVRFARDIPGAKLVRVPDCNHYVPVEKPDVVAREIAAFLE